MNMIDRMEKSFAQVVCAGVAILTVSLAQGGTVAYWPMVMDPATGGNTRTIADESGNGYTLKVNLADADVTNTSEGAFSRPPNGPDDVTASSCVEINKGTSLTKYPFYRGDGSSDKTSDPLILAMGLLHDFTIEGYMYVKSLKHTESNRDTCIAFSGMNGNGDWLWSLTETAQNSNKRDVTVSIRGGGPGVDNSGILCTIDDNEILGGWHHYALVFKFNEANNKSRWTFYLDGVNRGSGTMNSHTADQNKQHDRFLLGGVGADSKKVFDAKLAFWRVSDEALMPPQFLCCEGNPLIWKGAVDSAEWSAGAAANWVEHGVSASWTDAKDAYFVDSYATNRIEITGTVNPASINVIANSDMRLDFDKARSSAIGAGCTNFVKYGLGTFQIYYADNTANALLKGACPIEVREGTLRVNAANSNGALGDASRGYEVKVYDHATLSLYARNVIGSGTPDVANDSVFTVYTNGTFDMSSGSFNIQALGTLDLLGGNFVAPAKCHGFGYLLIRNRLTLGCNPGKRPYVFPAVRDQDDKVTIQPGITIGRNTEFRVEDVTGDAAADGIFNCAVMARTADASKWQDADNPCGFRKTGGGTMELNNPSLGSDRSHDKPTGVIAVEAGELRVNIDYSNASKYTVADGAFLSGTGKVSKVEFADGAGMRIDATKADVLELEGADFAGSGVIELSGVLPENVKNLRVNCAKVGDPVTGAANLSNWKVKVDGVENPNLAVRMHGGFLRASFVKGLRIIYR